MKMINAMFLALSDLELRTDDGEDIGALVRSLTFNAAIGAFELRALVLANPVRRSIPDLTKRGPLHVFAQGVRFGKIHFEAVTLIPLVFEVGEGSMVGQELHVLRGARFEVENP